MYRWRKSPPAVRRLPFPPQPPPRLLLRLRRPRRPRPLPRPLPPQPHPPGAETINAPMPGNIVNVQVKAGDTVTKGQVLLVLEAMKMENEIMAPRDGVIAGVPCEQGRQCGFRQAADFHAIRLFAGRADGAPDRKPDETQAKGFDYIGQGRNYRNHTA